MRKRKRKKSEREKLIKRADDLWSEIIRKRDGRCLRCFGYENLQASHIVPRTDFLLRHDLQNGIALCYKCHIHWWHKHIKAAYRWFAEKFPVSMRDLDRKEANRNRLGERYDTEYFRGVVSRLETIRMLQGGE